MILRKLLFLSTLFIMISCSKSMDKSSKIKVEETPINIDTQINFLREGSTKSEIIVGSEKYEYLIDYIRGELLDKPEYDNHLIDKRLLNKLNNVFCNDSYAKITDQLENGMECEIEIRSVSKLLPDQELIYDGNRNIIEVNGKYPYGAEYENSDSSVGCLSSISLKINGITKHYNLDSIVGLYNPNFCHFGGFTRMIEAYEHNDYIYIYIQGGNAASTYYSKLIFDHTQFITEITVPYHYLSITGSFNHYKFSGF